MSAQLGHSPAAERNKAPILAVLKQTIGNATSVLEVASGTGQHAVHFAAQFPHAVWQPSDVDPEHLQSISAWRERSNLANVLTPMLLDVTQPATWPAGPFDALFCANMIHISPWSCTQGLFQLASRVLSASAAIVLYGPFRIDGMHTAASNAEFDAWLKARDSRWGVRDLADVQQVAREYGFMLRQRHPMPANNFTLVFDASRATAATD